MATDPLYGLLNSQPEMASLGEAQRIDPGLFAPPPDPHPRITQLQESVNNAMRTFGMMFNDKAVTAEADRWDAEKKADQHAAMMSKLLPVLAQGALKRDEEIRSTQAEQKEAVRKDRMDRFLIRATEDGGIMEGGKLRQATQAERMQAVKAYAGEGEFPPNWHEYSAMDKAALQENMQKDRFAQQEKMRGQTDRNTEDYRTRRQQEILDKEMRARDAKNEDDAVRGYLSERNRRLREIRDTHKDTPLPQRSKLDASEKERAAEDAMQDVLANPESWNQAKLLNSVAADLPTSRAQAAFALALAQAHVAANGAPPAPGTPLDRFIKAHAGKP